MPIWMSEIKIEMILKIVSKRDVLISEKKRDRTKVNATHITLRLK